MQAPPISSQRALPFVARKDLVIRQIHYRDEPYWVVKDPVRLEYYRLQAEQFAVFELLDGHRCLEEIRAHLASRFPAKRPGLAQIQSLIFDLYEKGLIWSDRPGQQEALSYRERQQRVGRWQAAVKNIFFIRLPGWDSEGVIRRLYPLAGWIFHPLVVILAAGLVLLAWTLLLVEFESFQQRLPELNALLTWRSLVVVWLSVGFAKILHELGHALACRHFGGECHEIGVAFLIFSPCLYCDVSDSWLLSSKWSRMAVAAAGIYIELILSALALVLWWNASPGLVQDCLLSLFLVTNASVVFFNLNPLLRLDGYYLFSDWLEIPNLRQKSEAVLGRLTARHCFGVTLPVDPLLPTRGQSWFLLYALMSMVYRLALVLLISVIVYRALRPYQLQDLGLLLGGSSLVLAAVSAGSRFFRFVQNNGEQMWKSPRTSLTIACAIAVSLFVCLAPFPLQVEAPVIVEPVNVHHVYATTPGRVVAVHVRPGDSVTKGDVLITLEDWRRLARYRQVVAAREVQAVATRMHEAAGQATQHALAMQALRSLDGELAAMQIELQRLTLVAPCDGTVVAPPPRTDPSPRGELSDWDGAAIDPNNLGCFVSPGAHVLSIAPGTGYQARLLIDPFDRSDVAVSRKARIKLNHLPRHTFHGIVTRMAPSALDVANPNSLGNSPEIRSAAEQYFASGATSAFQATIALPPNLPSAAPGIQGRARIQISRRSLASWMWRHFRNTFQFDL